LAKTWQQDCFGSLLAGTLLFSSKDISANMQNLSQARETIANNSQEQLLLEEQLAHEQAQARVAEARYKAGCTIVVAVKAAKNLATLVEGETVLDRTTKKSLPNGTVVCDGNGNTGVLVAGKDGVPVVGQMAFTGDRALATEQVRQIKGAKVYYYTPEK
jgi:hypothetical protein